MWHFTLLLLFILKIDRTDGLWAELGQQHHALPLQRAVLAVQLQGGETERHRTGNTNVSVSASEYSQKYHDREEIKHSKKNFV